MKKKAINSKLYIAVLLITLAIFIVAFYISDYINNRKTEELKSLEDKVSLDILSFETQFDIVQASSCKEFDNTKLQTELDSLSSKLTYMENQVGNDNPEVFRLKRYYSLLEVRDYFLTKRMSDQCKSPKLFVLYFYSNNNCSECRRQEYMLRAVKDAYPAIDIYTFDYDLDLPSIKALIPSQKDIPIPPFMTIQGKVYGAFDEYSDMKNLIEHYLPATSTTTATSTKL